LIKLDIKPVTFAVVKNTIILKESFFSMIPVKMAIIPAIC